MIVEKGFQFRNFPGGDNLWYRKLVRNTFQVVGELSGGTRSKTPRRHSWPVLVATAEDPQTASFSSKQSSSQKGKPSSFAYFSDILTSTRISNIFKQMVGWIRWINELVNRWVSEYVRWVDI